MKKRDPNLRPIALWAPYALVARIDEWCKRTPGKAASRTAAICRILEERMDADRVRPPPPPPAAKG
jgi:hypothetical protein